MSFSRKTIIYAAAPLTLAAVLATTAGATAASASVHQPPRVASGSVELGTPLQYEQFLALQGFGRNHGVVDYTNWTAFGDTGSGVYAPQAAPLALTFYQGSTPYAHTLNGASLKEVALSPDKLAFSGTGSYPGTPWTIRGQVNDNRLHAEIRYDGQSYKVVLNGKIAKDGSASGTAQSNTGQKLTWAMPAGSFGSVLHYVAPVKSDAIQRHDATFTFTIPAGHLYAGTVVTVKVHDGGRGAKHDAYAHGVAPVLSQYPIIGGPGVTIR